MYTGIYRHTDLLFICIGILVTNKHLLIFFVLKTGLMWTAAVSKKVLDALNIPVDIRNICVMLAPFMVMQRKKQ